MLPGMDFLELDNVVWAYGEQSSSGESYKFFTSISYGSLFEICKPRGRLIIDSKSWLETDTLCTATCQ